MAPVSANKRRRGEDEARRPKKKFKHVKRQAEYHSSSDESEVEGRVYDAPREAKGVKAARLAEAAKPKEGVNATPIAARPKPILKQKNVKPVQIETADDGFGEVDDEDEDEDEDEKLARNTAMNAIPVQQDAESGSDEEDEEDEANDEPDLASSAEDDEEAEEDTDLSDLESETSSMTSSQAARNKKKRNDPTAFATSISKILDTKLTSAKRADPVLSRSKSAADANKTLANDKLEQKARAQIRSERKAALDRGRVKDVLGLETPDVDTGAILEEEKRLKKTAQRGVVKLFNAVRAAQVKGEEAMKAARQEGVVGMRQREERVNEMSKQGFLDLISSGGKKAATAASA